MKISATSLVLFMLLTGSVHAGSGAGAINLSFNTATRFEAMGSAGVGAPWGTDTNHWANPALLAFRPGLNYLKYRSELAVGLADDIVLTNEELTLGAYGVTLLLAKGPVDGNFLDMGEQIGTDENGVPTGVFESYMKSESWGLGVDVVRVLDRILDHGDQGWSRYATLAAGFTRHEFADVLAPDNSLQDNPSSGRGSGNVIDKGFVIRVTPLRNDAPQGWSENGYLGLTAGMAYGYCLKSDTDEVIRHVETNQSDPFPRAYLKGWSVHLALPLAPAVKDRAGGGFRRLLTDAIDPFICFTYSSQVNQPGYVWNQTAERYDYIRDDSGLQDENGHGWELGLANIFFVRRGHVEAAYGDIDGDTTGYGINLQAGRMAGFRWDHARVPQARELPTVERDGWSVWVDAVAIFDRQAR